MHKFKVEDPFGHSIGSGEIIGLTAAQLAPRAHRVEILDDKPSGQITRVRVLEALQFKAGEVLHLDRAPKDGITGTAPAANSPPKAPVKAKAEKRDANGDTAEMAELRKMFDASYAEIEKKLEAALTEAAKAKADGRAEMLADVEARNAVFEAAETALDAVEAAEAALAAEPDATKKAPLQAALDAARAAQAAADQAVAELPELKA